MALATAEALIALDMEGRGRARRAAREAPLPRAVLRAFLERGEPLPVDVLAAALAAAGHLAVAEGLQRLDEDDLLRVRDGHVDLVYPFSAAPTAFVVRLADGRERYVCCAVDALGIAPMIGQPVEVRARCHQSGQPLTFPVTPAGPGPEAAGVTLWVGRRTEARCRGIDGF